VFDEPLFNSRIKLAQSPLLDGPPLMFKPCPAAPIQRPQCCDVWNWLFELTTQMAQDRGRYIVQRSQCRAGHAYKAELQGGTDPVPRAECLADGTPVAIIEREPLLQQEIGQGFREVMPADIRRLKYAHGEPPLGELRRISPRPSWSNEKVIHRKPLLLTRFGKHPQLVFHMFGALADNAERGFMQSHTAGAAA
jgi:hypothetical protein